MPARTGEPSAPHMRAQIEPDMNDQKNTILAIVLSALVLIALAVFRRHAADGEAEAGSAAQAAATAAASDARPQPGQPAPAAPGGAQPRPPGQGAAPDAAGQQLTREAVLDAIAARRRSRRRGSRGSIALKGGAHRRPRADAIPRDGRSEIAADRAALAVGQPASVLRRVRLGRRRRAPPLKLPDADTVWTQQGSGALGVGKPVTLDLGQRRRARLPPHHLGRRQVPVHRQGRGREQERGAGHALSLWPDLAPRHAADARATTSCTKA